MRKYIKELYKLYCEINLKLKILDEIVFFFFFEKASESKQDGFGRVIEPSEAFSREETSSIFTGSRDAMKSEK